MEVDQNVRNLITGFRSLAQDPDGKKSLRITVQPDVFLAPTQAVVFEFMQPDYTVIFFTHLESESDQSITFAAKGSFAELLHTLPEKWGSLEDKKIRFRWSPSSSEGMRSMIEDTVQRLFGDLAEEICRREPAHFRISLSPDVAILEVRARLAEIDATTLVAELATHAQGSGIAVPRPFQEGPRERKAHAGNIFPLTMVGEERKPTFQEKVRGEWKGQELWKLSKRSWASSCDQIPLIVFAEGMVVADTPHEDRALQAINSFLALCQYFDHDCIPMTVYNLGHVTITSSGIPSSWGGPVEIGRQIFASKKNLPEEKLQRVFRVLEKCEDKDLTAQLRLWHAGCAHFLSGENLQAFVLGWTAIENLLGKLWKEQLVERGIDHGRLDKLTSPQGGFTSDHIIEFLNLVGSIDATKYSRLQDLRKTRNKTVHSGCEPLTDDTGQCLHVAGGLLSERLNSYLTPTALT